MIYFFEFIETLVKKYSKTYFAFTWIEFVLTLREWTKTVKDKTLATSCKIIFFKVFFGGLSPNDFEFLKNVLLTRETTSKWGLRRQISLGKNTHSEWKKNIRNITNWSNLDYICVNRPATWCWQQKSPFYFRIQSRYWRRKSFKKMFH